MIHTDYYTGSSYRRNSDFSLVASHICATKLLTAFTKKVEDFRFNEFVPYIGIGNSSIMRLNACAYLRVNMWCLKPGGTWEKKAIQYLGCVLLKPLAAASDVLLNTALLVIKISMMVGVVTGKSMQKIFSSKKSVDFRNTLKYSARNIGYQIKALFDSCLPLLYQCFAVLSVNWAGPKIGFKFDSHEQFHWAYFVNQHELVLDTNRVKYMKEKCGWGGLPEETFKTYCQPSKKPSVRISYFENFGTLHFHAEWTVRT
jgi:hypothetical protein